MPSIYKLKKLMMESNDLTIVLNYFLTLSDTTNTIPLSQLLDSEEDKQDPVLCMLIQVIENMAGNFLKKEIKITHPMICHIATDHFYHGFFVSNEIEIPITICYFSDLKKGLFSIAKLGENTEIFRFSLANSKEEFAVH